MGTRCFRRHVTRLRHARRHEQYRDRAIAAAERLAAQAAALQSHALAMAAALALGASERHARAALALRGVA
jgi:hypothetical protein